MHVATNPIQEDAVSQMRDVLQNDFFEMRVTRYALTEDFETGDASVTCSVAVNNDAAVEVVGNGVGMIDALFNGLKILFAPEYPSLDSIRFTSFSVKGLIDDENDSTSQTDAKAEARIGVTNSYGTEFDFAAVTGSVSRSSVEAVVAAAQYFVNSERAYVTMYKALRHYKDEGRTDLVGKYTAMLADMVRNTSYSRAVERIKSPD